MPNFAKAGLIIFIAFILQISLVPHLAVGRAAPDLIMLTVIMYGFSRGPAVGSIAGFSGGLLQDFAGFGAFGLNTISKLLVGYLSGLVERALVIQNFYLMAAAIFLASLFQSLAAVGVLFLLGEVVPVGSFLFNEYLPSALYNTALGVLLFHPIGRWLGEEMTHSRSVVDGKPG